MKNFRDGELKLFADISFQICENHKIRLTLFVTGGSKKMKILKWKKNEKYYQVCEIRTPLRQGMQWDICNCRAAAEVQPLQFVAVQRQALAGAVAQLLAVLQVQRFDWIAVLKSIRLKTLNTVI